MATFHFNEVYVEAAATAVGPMENQGPLHGQFDVVYDDVYCGQDTYEKAERQLVFDAYQKVLSKSNIKASEIELAIGGDLMNQLATSHYFIKDTLIPFLGVYGACATSCLAGLVASICLDSSKVKRALTFCSSHNATAERQYRFPNEYGVQKPPTTTFTATGAGAILFSKKPSKIRCSEGTLGRVIDLDFKNANDMGSAMAPAAFDTISRHFNNTHTGFEDYDLILTGDLSSIGHDILIDCFKFENQDHLGKLVDCGCILYDRERQPVFAGGSGCACSSLVMIAWLFDKLAHAELHKVMVVATGALLTPVILQQKGTIPCVAHALVFESEARK